MTDRLVEVAPAVPLPATARQTYTYRLRSDADQSVLYRSVMIPLGSRSVRGYIMGEVKTLPPFPLKTTRLLPAAALTAPQVAMATWLHNTQRGGLGYTLRLFVPPPSPPPPAPLPKKIPSAKAIIQPNTSQRWTRLARCLQPYLNRQQSVLIIVPEKWQLAPLAEFMAEEFKLKPIVIHAALRSSILSQALAKLVAPPAVVIGTQKALFLPHVRLGAIVLEEENYSTHKLWDQYPRLANWHGAEQLAKFHRAAMIYSSSFPSVRLFGIFPPPQNKSIGRLPALPPVQLWPLTYTDRRSDLVLPAALIHQLRHWLKQKPVVIVHTLSAEHARRWRHQLHRLFGRSSRLTIALPSDLHHFGPAYDAVIWLFPEQLLQYPDYRSRERAYILLHRLAQLRPLRQPLHLVTRLPGRLEAELLLPPDRYFHAELKARQRLHYPPFAEVVRLTFPSQAAERMRTRLKKARGRVIVRGPVAGQHLILRGSLSQLTALYRDVPVSTADLDPFKLI